MILCAANGCYPFKPIDFKKASRDAERVVDLATMIDTYSHCPLSVRLSMSAASRPAIRYVTVLCTTCCAATNRMTASYIRTGATGLARHQTLLGQSVLSIRRGWWEGSIGIAPAAIAILIHRHLSVKPTHPESHENLA